MHPKYALHSITHRDIDPQMAQPRLIVMTSGLNFTELLKHKKVAQQNKIMYIRIRLPDQKYRIISLLIVCIVFAYSSLSRPF